MKSQNKNNKSNAIPTQLNNEISSHFAFPLDEKWAKTLLEKEETFVSFIKSNLKSPSVSTEFYDKIKNSVNDLK